MSARYREIVLRDRPVGYWRLGPVGDVPYDESGNANHATARTGTPTNGLADSPALHDASGGSTLFSAAGAEWYSVPDAASLDLGDVFSLEAWVKISVSGGIRTIFDKGTGGYLLRITGARLIELVKEGTGVLADSNGQVAAGKWAHIVATKNGSARAIYLNGADITDLGTNATCTDTATALLIGKRAAGTDYFDGQLAEAAIYNYALTSAQVLAHYYAGINPDRYAAPAVRLRNPFPPHETLIDLQAADVRAGYMLCRKGTASFSVSRAAHGLDEFAHLIQVGAMASIERSDGALPWLGFVTAYDDNPADPYIRLRLEDHAFLLEQARTRWGGTASGASARVIREALYEMDARAEPPIMLDLDLLQDAGPPIDWEFKGEKGFGFLQRVRAVTGWEWAITPVIDHEGVRARLQWLERLGVDRRESVRLEEGVHLTDVSYSARARGFAAATFITAGRGAQSDLVALAGFATRAPTDVTSISLGQHRDTDAPTSPALLGTRTLHEPQVSTADALRDGVLRLYDAPEHVAEQISFRVSERSIDMRNFGVGDTITVQTQNTVRPLRRFVRVLGIQIDADSESHDIEAQVLACQC